MLNMYERVYYPEQIKNGAYLIGDSNKVKEMVKAIKKKYSYMDIINMDSMNEGKMREYAKYGVQMALANHEDWINVKVTQADVSKAWKKNSKAVAGNAFSLLMEDCPDSIFYGKNMEYIICDYINCDEVYMSLDGTLILCDKVKSDCRLDIEDFAEGYISFGYQSAYYDDFLNYLKGKTDTYENMHVDSTNNFRYMYESLIGLEGLVDDRLY